jgi:hypothetical protein
MEEIFICLLLKERSKLCSMKMAEHAEPIEEIRNTNKIIVPIPEGKRLRGPTWHIREGNIKMELKKKGREGVNRIHPPQNAVQCEHVSPLNHEVHIFNNQYILYRKQLFFITIISGVMVLKEMIAVYCVDSYKT